MSDAPVVLPPLPQHDASEDDGKLCLYWFRDSMQAYATAAVLADRQARPDMKDRVIAQHVLALKQLLDIWDAGMPDETARDDMVEAFDAVRAVIAPKVPK
jgi:hypothetical protein